MNLLKSEFRIVTKQRQLLISKPGVFIAGECNVIAIGKFLGSPDDIQNTLLRDKKFLLGENDKNVIKAQTLHFRPIYISAAQRFITFLDQLYVSTFSHSAKLGISNYISKKNPL